MSDTPLPLEPPASPAELSWIEAYRDPLGADERPFALLRQLHTQRGLPPTARLGRPWSEDIGDGWLFHMNGSRDQARLCEAPGALATVCLPRHLLVFRHGQPVLLIDTKGGWGTPDDRAAFVARLAIFLETLKGEAT